MSVVKTVLHIERIFNWHCYTLYLRKILENLHHVLSTESKLGNLEEVEETLEHNLRVYWMLIVLLKDVGVVHKILL